tara:strand:+ start:207 stop:350 length:144 start_codon:yes stop_codon:yes gene_type:complete
MKYLLIVLLLSSCSTKTHVIDEMDGDREVRWYSQECDTTLKTVNPEK